MQEFDHVARMLYDRPGIRTPFIRHSRP